MVVPELVAFTQTMAKLSSSIRRIHHITMVRDFLSKSSKSPSHGFAQPLYISFNPRAHLYQTSALISA
jgi:hypothetical protein